MEREGLTGPITDLVRRGAPTLGTCAGLIMLDRDHLGLLDVTTRRNAFGRQLRSFEAELEIDGQKTTGVFIRAPWVEEAGEGVEILAEVEGHPVAVRQGNIMAVAFHPELTDDAHVHEWVLKA
jgi:5'-phosphate synthase pdxT subunit